MGKKNTFYEINVIRWLMIFWIFITHFYEHYEKGAYFANPSQYWPPLTDRFAQLKPLPVEDVWSVFSNLFRYLGLFGDQGVQVFFVISGFVLTISVLSKSQDRLDSREFLSRRLAKIYPSWVISHIALMIAWLAVGTGVNPFSVSSWFSLVGIRFLPQTMYHAVPAWWFVGCLLQLYVLFPFIYNLTIGRKRSVILWSILFGAILLRLIGLYASRLYAPGFIDYWSRGMLFVGRLPEFTAGIIIAYKFHKNPDRFLKTITAQKPLALFFGIWILGNFASFFYSGMAIAFLLTGVGLFLFLWGILLKLRANKESICSRYAAESYEFYLVHHVVIIALVPTTFSNPIYTPVFFFVVLSASILSAFVLNRIVRLRRLHLAFAKSINFLLRKYKTVFAVIALLYAVGLTGELLVQRYDPQEVLGWGERPALQPHDEFGYNLIPNKTTRLRWQSYDYVVTSNALGFPGPLYSEEKGQNKYRIMVTGDAFSSAEGVDTNESWPRLLETYLNENSTGTNYEVLNFSITGWGPQHYSRVVKKYLPIYKPDLLILGIFINDLVDVLYTDESFDNSIGFSHAAPFSFETTLKLKHVRSFIDNKINKTISFIRPGKLPKDVYLGQLSLMEKKNATTLLKGSILLKDYLHSIKINALICNAEVKAILIPASIQVTQLNNLYYMPNNLNLNDALYDLQKPQEIIKDIFNSTGIPLYDLHTLLSKKGEILLYQSHNMHWTKAGHIEVASFLNKKILSIRQ